MTLQESIQIATECVAVEETKFDRHMIKARRQDNENRQKIFIQQTERMEAKRERISGIEPLVY